MNEDNDRIEGLERLARRRAPGRDLWPGIRARLAPRRRDTYLRGQLALAASVVAALTGIFALGLRELPDTPPAGVALVLPRESRAIVQANLSLVKHAERQVRQALKQDPESPALRSLLASTENRQRALRAML